jgi:hypothetical protein
MPRRLFLDVRNSVRESLGHFHDLVCFSLHGGLLSLSAPVGKTTWIERALQ